MSHRLAPERPRHRGRLGALAVAGTLLVACGGEERSAAKFCDTMRSEKARIRQQLDAAPNPATDDETVRVLSGLGASVQALGELRTYFRKLARVAPNEIRDAAEIVAEEYEEQLDRAGAAASDPFGSFAAALVGSLATSGPLMTLDSFARANCGESI